MIVTVIGRGEMGRRCRSEGFGDGDGIGILEGDRQLKGSGTRSHGLGCGIVIADRVIEAACTCFDAGVGGFLFR